MSVTRFNRKMQLFFQKDSFFKEVYVKGEVSGANYSSKGNLFFNLKDKDSVVPCVILRKNRRNVDFEIVDGMKLLVIADVVVYRPHGKYQLDVFEVSEDGLGKLFIKYQQLKEKLTKEGLFNKEFKKDLPNFPKSIGVITSKEGSVIHDIIRTVNRQWPYCKLLIFPSQVQGAAATNQLVTQIKKADSFGLDTLIVARGGGSIEDLWCFNDESLVRTVFECETPVISAIGHENDNTLCDLVSDMQASTPTMAANIAINDKEKISNQVSNYNVRLLTFMSSKIDDYKKQFNYMISKQLFTDSNYIYGSKKRDFDDLCNHFGYNSKMLISSKKNILNEIKTSYVIRHPCKIQLDLASTKLNELQNRLIDAINLILKTNRANLDKASDEFKFSSNNYLSTQKIRLNNIKNSYSIQNPCKIQLNKYNNDLKVFQDKLIKSINYKLDSSTKDYENLLNRNLFNNPNLIYKNKVQKLNKLTNEFKNKSNEIILTNSYRLDSVKNKQVIKNPDLIYINKTQELNQLANQFENKSREVILTNFYRLNSVKNKQVIKNPDFIYMKKTQELNGLVNQFENKSREVILTNSYRLDSIKNKKLIKNPEIIFKTKHDDLDKIKEKSIIKNPQKMLDNYNQRLNVCKEKLDKIDQVILLKQEQEKQKSTYRKIIIVIIVIVILIIILLINGGI